MPAKSGVVLMLCCCLTATVNSYGHVGAVGYCKTLIFGGYFILAILAVKA